MLIRRFAVVEGKSCPVTISDEHEALLAAYAAGGAIVGIWNPENPGRNLNPADYVAESPQDIDEEFLERVVRRRLGLPWVITRTKRLIIREFCIGDLEHMIRDEDSGVADEIFLQEEMLKAYMDCQYRFFEWGIWALVEKETQTVIGKAGIFERFEAGDRLTEKEEDTPLELGYHVFSPYRRSGYGLEACKGILDYVEHAHITDRITAVIRRDNIPSLKLIENLGFQLITEECNESAESNFLYEWNCPGSR